MKKDQLTFLIFGDVFGKLGRNIVSSELGSLKKKYKPDLTLANIENLTHGSGFSMTTINELMDAGVDFFTGGNHSLDNRNGVEALSIENVPVLRPANLGKNIPGDGFRLIEQKGKKILVVNLIGQLLMPPGYDNPFQEVGRILRKFEGQKLDAMIVDIHAETTSEKAAMAYFLDGKASVIFGTHTHVPTADERILPKGTGFITDVGFTGPYDSIIGIAIEPTMANFAKQGLIKAKTSIVETGRGYLNCIYVEVDSEGKCTHIERITKIIE